MSSAAVWGFAQDCGRGCTDRGDGRPCATASESRPRATATTALMPYRPGRLSPARRSGPTPNAAIP
jgi:hypothetical protein